MKKTKKLLGLLAFGVVMGVTPPAMAQTTDANTTTTTTDVDSDDDDDDDHGNWGLLGLLGLAGLLGRRKPEVVHTSNVHNNPNQNR
ncbi:WGxxGxxG family protein [Hymenobacter sp. BT730]|uniref:WGxxGxxG family protein n=1 Tax=Hymenobacter sp. BT730 TaxID=3063332 RepID=UPI0026DFF4D8|nr:WGxxGxxG family protein [Hymenobacter sp. BT730]